jgi:predicted nuclease of predicted toxin-antitoxin system
VKFKLDENMPADLAALLRQEGHDVADVPGEGLSGEDDPPVLGAATTEGRVLMTFDLDFADVRHYPPGSHGGIIVFRLHDQRWSILERPARRLLAQGNLEELKGGLAIVDETRIRYRRATKKKRP